MLRFGTSASVRPRSTSSRARRGIWMLVLMLGLVMLLMRQLNRPGAAAVLGGLFAPTAPPAADISGPAAVGGGQSSSSGAEVEQDRAPLAAAPALDGPWAAVKDNALFTNDEKPAWFSLFEEVRQTPPAELARQAVDVVYAQLANQPDAYRTKPVRVRGRVLRESVKRAPVNNLGIEAYHQLWLAPVGGGDLPMVVYSLDLPAGFPRGDKVAADVTVDGLFFKNWTFAYDGGMGIAPVVVSRSVAWKGPAVVRPRPAATLGTRWLGAGIAAAALAAVGFIAWVMRQTRRPRIARDEPAADFSNLEAGP